MKKIIFLLMSALLMTQVSCMDEKVLDEFKVSISPDAVVSKTQITVVNATDIFSSIGTSTIKFTSAADVANIYTVGGTKSENSSFTIEDGNIILGVVATEQITASNPLVVNATISADGYLDKNMDFVFTGADTNSFTVKLIEKNNTPDGVAIDTQSIALNESGETSSAVSFSIANTENGGGSFDFEIAEGTEIQSDSKTFDATMISVSPNKESSAEFIAVQTVSEDFSFTTTSDISKIGATKGVQNVDYSYQPTKPWIVFTFGAVSAEGIKSGVQKYMSFFNVSEDDMYVLTNGVIKRYSQLVSTDFVKALGAGVVVENTCNITSINNITLVNDGLIGFYKYTITNSNNAIVGSGAFTLPPFSNTEFTVEDLKENSNLQGFTNLVSANLSLKVEVYSFDNSAWQTVTELDNTTLCDLSTIDVSNPDCSTAELGDIDLRIECEDVKISLNNTLVYYKEESSNQYTVFGIIKDGFVTDQVSCLDVSKNYNFRIWYEGYKESSPINATQLGGGIDISEEVCEEVDNIF